MTETAARGCALAAALWVWSAPDVAGQTARVTLLPAGQRASVVVELDDLLTGATSIEATDSQTVQVDIGPVRGKVINQLLQAAADSPLVSQVRVRGITRGAEGTIVAVQVTGKAPMSGSVRRSARRIYIDLEPLAPVRPSEADAGLPPAAPGRIAPVAVAAAPKPATPLTPPPAPRSPARPTAPPVPTPSEGPLVAETPPPAPAVRVPPRSGRASAPMPLLPADPPSAARAPAAAPALAAATPAATPAPPPATVQESRAPLSPQVTTRSDATPTAVAGGTTKKISDVEALAERLARVPDVKGLEKLKADLLAKRKGPDRDGLIAKVDQYVLEAQRNRLAADAALFRDATPPPAAPSRTSQLAAVRALRPQLEQIARAVNGWSGGPAPQELVTLSATLPKLRQLHLPANMTEAHSDLCKSLEGLAVIWAKSSAEPIAPGTDLLPPAVGRARSALDTFLALERSLSAQPNAQ